MAGGVGFLSDYECSCVNDRCACRFMLYQWSVAGQCPWSTLKNESKVDWQGRLELVKCFLNEWYHSSCMCSEAHMQLLVVISC